MDKPFLLLDIDGVCLNWEKGLMRFVHLNMPHLHQPTRIDDSAFDLSTKLGIPSDVANSLVWDFHYDTSFAQLEPMEGAVDAISRLRDKYRLVAITACGNEPEIVQSRNINLQVVFDNAFERVVCTNTSHEKRKYLMEYPPSNWVEDHLYNAIMGSECGHRSWLINASHNQTRIELSNVTRIDSLVQLVPLIL